MFDPEDFAKLGHRMVQNPCGFADSRTAISRAYYSAFLTAKRHLGLHFQWPKTAEIHDQIQMLFVNCNSDSIKAIGRKLNDLRGKRNDADYDLHARGVDRHDAQLQLGIAQGVIDELNRLSISPAEWDPIINEMKIYAKLTGGKFRIK
ncbi:MAG TPA: hypothetical protein VFC46_02110 [Humisphaera sp.]|nr:hypothetical protein [Humisphaera sp.]